MVLKKTKKKLCGLSPDVIQLEDQSETPISSWVLDIASKALRDLE
jgi:hypothetical protein